MARAADDDPFRDEYAAIEFRLDGGLMSLAFFVLQLATPYLARWQPWRPRRIWLWPLVSPGVIFVLAVLGVLCALWGRRRAKGSAAARIGLLLNGIVFAILLLWGLLMMFIVRGGRNNVSLDWPRPPERHAAFSSLSSINAPERSSAPTNGAAGLEERKGLWPRRGRHSKPGPPDLRVCEQEGAPGGGGCSGRWRLLRAVAVAPGGGGCSGRWHGSKRASVPAKISPQPPSDTDNNDELTAPI